MNRDKKEKIQNELAYREDQYLKNKKPFEESLEEKIDYQKVIPIAEQKKIKKVQPSFIGHGKRKRAFCLAQIILNGSGKITVNKKPFHFYFPNPGHRTKIMIPLVFADKLATVDVKIRVAGGGYNGQLDAIIPAIARAFVKYNPDLYTEFKKNLMLVHDPRNVERKHPGFIKARKAYVFNKR